MLYKFKVTGRSKTEFKSMLIIQIHLHTIYNYLEINPCCTTTCSIEISLVGMPPYTDNIKDFA